MSNEENFESNSYKEVENPSLGLSFFVPAEAVVEVGKQDGQDESPLLMGATDDVSISIGSLQVTVTSFEVEFDFNQIDWLEAYAELLGYNTNGSRIIENNKDSILGELKFSPKSSQDQTFFAYLLIKGKKGIFVTSNMPDYNPLIASISASIQMHGAAWGNIDKKDGAKLGGQEFAINSGFRVHPSLKGRSDTLLITNADSIAQSTIILRVIENQTGASHTSNSQTFAQDMKGFGLSAKFLSASKAETVFSAVAKGGSEYIGYTTTLDTGYIVSLIAPKITTDPISWLSGKFYYTNTIRALSSQAQK